MNRFAIGTKSPTHITYGLLLSVIFAFALFLRVYFPYDNVFGGDWVRFQINDPWYHMRSIENLVQHFPHLNTFDPYLLYPSGQDVFTAPFFDLFIGFFIWGFGLGSPSKELIETVGAYFPAILGALVTIPVYFIGKELFNRKAGLVAAAIIAILPGQFLLRSLLGFTDHHVAETLFSSLTMLFLLLAVKSSKQNGLSFNSLLARDWVALKRPLIYSLLTGLLLSLYLLSWVGGALLVLIILAYIVIQYVIDHLRGRPNDYLCTIGVLSFLIALLIVAPLSGQYEGGTLQVALLLIGILSFIALSGVALLLTRVSIRPVYYPLALILVVGLGLVSLRIVDPSLLNSVLRISRVLNPSEVAAQIIEVQGLSLASAWANFTTVFYLSLVSLAIMTYLVIKEGASDKTLLLVWSALMLVATFGQSRFAYYFAVNAALLTAFLAWRVLEFAGFRDATDRGIKGRVDGTREIQMRKGEVNARTRAKRKERKAQKLGLRALIRRYLGTRYADSAIAIVTILLVIFLPNMVGSIDLATASRGPSQDWYNSLVWMRENTPDPFEDPGFYYELYEEPVAGEVYHYPESAYGVMSWWSYGHWIINIAHRIPHTNPTVRQADKAARFFTARDESTANSLLDELGSKYVIIDIDMAAGRFPIMLERAGKSEDEFYEMYAQRTKDGKLESRMLFYPAYYESMCSRLYNFGGKAVIPHNSTWVISYVNRFDAKGNRYKEITEIANDGQPFATYEDAVAYIDLRGASNLRIVGISNSISPVPLEELQHYELIYQSPTAVTAQGEETISEVEIFEFKGATISGGDEP